MGRATLQNEVTGSLEIYQYLLLMRNTKDFEMMLRAYGDSVLK